MVDLGVVEGDDRLAEGGRVAGVEGGVPLAVFVAEADDDYVGVANQRLGADRVDPGALVVAPEGLALPTERARAGVVGGAENETGSPASRTPASIRSRQSEWISPER
jgi:hypothetical protein